MGLWDSVTGFFEDLGDFFSGKDFFECAGYAWNDMMKLATDVLTKDPSSGTYQERMTLSWWIQWVSTKALLQHGAVSISI